MQCGNTKVEEERIHYALYANMKAPLHLKVIISMNGDGRFQGLAQKTLKSIC